MELTKLNQALHTKENKKKNDHTILFTEGFGRHLTDAEVGVTLADQKHRKEAEVAEKDKRRAARVALGATKTAVEEKWKVMLEDYDQAVEAWKVECARLRVEGVRVKDLPARPKKPRKPKLTVEGPNNVLDAVEDEDELTDS